MSTQYKSWAQVFPTLILLLPLPSSGQSAPMSAANEAAMLRANDMEVLGGNEFMELKSELGPSTGEKLTHQYQLSNGKTYTVETDKNTSLSLIQGNSQVTTYVQPGPNATVHNMEDSSGPGPERIDSAIGRKLSGGAQTVPVIIEMDLPFEKFYEQGQNASTIAGKQSGFNSAKSRVAGLLRGKGSLKHDLKLIGAVAAALDQESLDQLSRSPAVKRITMDRTYKAILDASPNEVRATETWTFFDGSNFPLTGTGKRIAIIDTGVDYTHADLGGCLGATCKVVGGYDFVNNDANPMDDQGHGTHVAATAAGNGLLKGIAPDAKILAYKVLSAAGSGTGSAIIAAIERATDPNNDGNPADHADVASMSLGGSGNPDDPMARAVDNSVAAGVVHVIAAGNSGPTASTIGSPGAARTAITVAAACAPHAGLSSSYCANPIASFSSRGPLIWNGVDIQKPDISAPGVMICAARWGAAFATAPTCFDSAHVRISGTSMATPHMAGAAALIRQAYPTYTPAQVKQLLKTSARSLGMSYNDQGAGMVDLHAAIPGSQKVTSIPFPWSVTTSPALKFSTTQQAFSVTPTLSAINTLSVSLNLPVPGVSVSFSKTLLQVSSKTTDSFTATLTADNDLAKAGTYTGSIVLSEGGVTQGAIPILLTISPTLVASASIIDYGIDDPSLSLWTSQVKTVSLTNRRSDVAQSVALTASSYASGITSQNPASLTVPAGGAASFSTSLTVENSLVANGFYSGSLTASNAANSLSLATKFTKFYVLTIQDSNSADLLNTLFWLHNRQNQQWLSFIGTNPLIFYLSNPGAYDMMFSYPAKAGSNGSYQSYTVFKEGISVTAGATNVSVSRSEAVNLITNSAKDIFGSLVSATRLFSELTYLPAPALGMGIIGGGIGLSSYYSNRSSNYKSQNVYTTAQPTQQNYYAFYETFTGISGPLSLGNAPGDLIKTTLRMDINLPDGTAISPTLSLCTFAGSICAGAYASKTFPLPFTQQYYTTLPSGYYIAQNPNAGQVGCSGTAACDSSFSSPYFNPASKLRRSWGGASPTLLSPISGDTIYTGLGPSVWFAKFANTASKIQFLANFGGPTTPFMRQDYALQEHEAIPYTLYKDGVQFASGNFSRFSLREAFMPGTNNLGSLAVASAGNYEARVDLPYKVKSQSMLGRVSAKFNNGLADPNPPAIQRLAFFSNNTRGEVYDPTLSNRLEFELNAVGGTISQAMAAYSFDGVNFTTVATTVNGAVYSSTLPALSGFSKIGLRIAATDSSGNSLSYTFELPVGAATPPGDTTPPTVALSAPANGALVSGSAVTISAGASDNVGVAGVQFKLDGANLGAEDTTAPYSLSWNTTLIANGTHTITAAARDAAGNTATSAANTVTIDNAAPAISAVASASISSSAATITWATNEPSNSQVNYGTSTTYGKQSALNASLLTSHSMGLSGLAASTLYHYRVKSRDLAGNLAISADFTFTTNAAPDTTPPTVALTAPADGALLSGSAVTISAVASDNLGLAGVQFKLDGAGLGAEDTTAPYSLGWNTTLIANGTHTITAAARDAAGNTATSAAVMVTVDNTAPTISGAAASAISSSAAAIGWTTNEPSNSQVEYGLSTAYGQQSALIGALLTSHSLGLSGLAASTLYHYRVKSRDQAGNLAVSGDFTFSTPAAPDTIAPTAAILSPASGANVKQDVSVKVSASDNKAVSRIELWADGALAKTQALSPAAPSATVSFAWRAGTKGKHTLQAKAYDAAGNSGASSLVTINVAGKIRAVSLVGAGSPALGDEPRALMLSLQQAKGGASLAFSDDIAEAAITDMRGRAIMSQSRQGSSFIMALRQASGGRQAMEAGVWLIQMKDNEGRKSVKPLVVVK